MMLTMAYKVVDIYKDLPRTNCGDCGKGSCFAFATAVYLEAFPLEQCPHLESAPRGEMEAKLDASRETGASRRPSSSEQALRSLLAAMAEADFAESASAAGAEYVPGRAPGDGEAVIVRFLDGVYRFTRLDVTAETGDPPTVWVKILLLIYLTRAAERTGDGRGEEAAAGAQGIAVGAAGAGAVGASAAGDAEGAVAATWVGYRDLPNTVSKAQTFEACVARIAERFADAGPALETAVAAIGGRVVDAGPADLAFRIDVLPRVPMLLLFWCSEEDFPAHASLLLDRSALDYLDQEALVFAAEALAGRLLGEDLSELVG